MLTRSKISEMQQKAARAANGGQETANPSNRYGAVTFEEVLAMCQRYITTVATNAFRRENDPAIRREMTISIINEFVDSKQAPKIGEIKWFEVEGYENLTELKAALADEITHYGPITKAMEDPTIDEIRANAYDQIFVEAEGRTVLLDKQFTDRDHMERIIAKLLAVSKARLTPKTPMVNARTMEGYRVNATHADISPYGQPSFVIRKFSKKSITAEKLIGYRSFSQNMYRLMSLVPRADLSWITVGPTGGGKTTLNEILVHEIDPMQRIITIENPSELRLIQRTPQGQIINDVLQYESVSDDDDASPATMENLLINAMRQSPHWIGPGELRTPGEFATALRAAQTGHHFFTTLHAEADEKALLRFLTAYMMISHEPAELAMRNICNAVKFIFYNERLIDGSRKVTSIAEVLGSEGLKPLMNKIYTYDHKAGIHRRIGCISEETQYQLIKSGIDESRFAFLLQPPSEDEVEVYC